MFKLFRSVKEEITTPIEGDVIGDLPEWIIGSVYRNGPGLFEVGDTKFFHWFDGMAIIQRFDIKNGKVNYQRKFLESEAYKANITANRIVFAEFGTRAYPDPNKNIIVNLLSKFIAKRTDNCPVNIIRIGKELFAVSETNYLHRFDPNTLETLERLNLSDLVDVNQASAHVHYDQTGTIHNIGYSYGVKTPKYCLYTITPTTSGTSKYSGKLIAALGIDNKLKPSYIHSFFMTENFYIYIEQPLVINALKVASAEIRQLPMSDCLEWRKDLKTRFHIVDRKTGIELNSNYVYEGVPFMMINQGNAFEDGGNIVLDLCAFKDGEVLNSYFMCNLAFEIPDGSPEGNFPPSTYQRFVLPLNLGKTTPIGTNLLSAAFSKSLAVRTSDTKISLTSEALSYECL
ncbi:beta,beta-carotene 15,15'-dioxygenase-like [Patella vulgata]|uniref:beta,beta-carotene 15,15'-dioxygenase-like n=1 Tax=Patella vulgata TaxID=6465 RepID=UPI0024A7E426|nr:beta,beta-carotene 15,15'-dioxygenase-like [Patella vulgata]